MPRAAHRRSCNRRPGSRRRARRRGGRRSHAVQAPVVDLGRHRYSRSAGRASSGLHRKYPAAGRPQIRGTPRGRRRHDAGHSGVGQADLPLRLDERRRAGGSPVARRQIEESFQDAWKHDADEAGPGSAPQECGRAAQPVEQGTVLSQPLAWRQTNARSRESTARYRRGERPPGSPRRLLRRRWRRREGGLRVLREFAPGQPETRGQPEAQGRAARKTIMPQRKRAVDTGGA